MKEKERKNRYVIAITEGSRLLSQFPSAQNFESLFLSVS